MKMLIVQSSIVGFLVFSWMLMTYTKGKNDGWDNGLRLGRERGWLEATNSGVKKAPDRNTVIRAIVDLTLDEWISARDRGTFDYMWQGKDADVNLTINIKSPGVEIGK